MLPAQYQSKNLNHLGLVAAMCRELKIAEYIDARITNDADERNVTIGQAVVAMIINGLGFTGQTLYMFPEFFDGDVQQRWLLFLNKKRRLSEQKTLTRKMQKQSLKEARDLEKLGKKAFRCQDDALKAFALWQKQSKLCQSETEPEIICKPCYSGKGRPSSDSQPDHFEYFVQAGCFVFCEARENAEASLGCFILGTNELNQDSLNAGELLSTYKSQQQVEGGFRFLKSPDFLVSSLYLFCFQGISVLTVNNQERHMVGLKERQWTIIQVLGIFYESPYS